MGTSVQDPCGPAGKKADRFVGPTDQKKRQSSEMMAESSREQNQLGINPVSEETSGMPHNPSSVPGGGGFLCYDLITVWA